MGKYTATKYPNITAYETRSGTRYRIRKKITVNGSPDIIDESGKRTIAEARARLREIEDQIAKEENLYYRAQKTTVNEYFKEYSERKIRTKKWTLDSIAGKQSIFKTHISPRFGNLTLIKLKRSDYEIFISDKLEKNRESTVRAINIAFMAMLNDAVKNGLLQRNNLSGIEIGDSDIPPKNKHISYEDYCTWMDTAKSIYNKYYYSIIVLFKYGLRRGEVCGIRKSSITYNDEGLAVVYINDSRTALTAARGKGTTKTKQSIRYVAFDKEGTEALNYLISESQKIRMKQNSILHEDDFLPINPRSKKAYSPNSLNHLFQRVSDECGIKIHPHMLRHFFATQAAIMGVPKEHAAAYLGHADKRMTELYTHIKNETASSVVDIVSRRIN